MHYEVERLNLTGRWLKTSGRSAKKYKLLGNAQLEATVMRARGSVVRIVRVTDDGEREVVEAGGA
jgi:hypothetical protein